MVNNHSSPTSVFRYEKYTDIPHEEFSKVLAKIFEKQESGLTKEQQGNILKELEKHSVSITYISSNFYCYGVNMTQL